MKYELRKRFVELPSAERAKIRPGVILRQECREPEVIMVFDTFEEAENELKKYRTFETEEFYIEPVQEQESSS